MRYIIMVSNIIDNKPNGTMTSLGVLSREFFWLAHDGYLYTCNTCTRKKSYTNAHTYTHTVTQTYTIYTWTQIYRQYYPKETTGEQLVFYIFFYRVCVVVRYFGRVGT